MRYTLVLILALFFVSAKAQDPSVMLLMNGKQLEIYQVDDSTKVIISYQYDKNFFKKERIGLREFRREKDEWNSPYSLDYSSDKAKQIPIVLKDGNVEFDEVFSIKSPEGVERVYYAPPEDIFPDEEPFSVSEMRAYVTGKKDARYGVRSKGWFYSGLAVGAVGGYAMRSSIWAAAIPPLFTLTTKIPVVKIREENISDKAYMNNLDYAAGYESRVRTRSAIEALKGSAIGTVLGIVVYTIVNNN